MVHVEGLAYCSRCSSRAALCKDAIQAVMAERQGRTPVEQAVEVDGEGIPQLRFPEPFNVAKYFIDRHVAQGRAGGNQDPSA